LGRARDPNRDKAFEIYSENNGNIELIEIAERLGVSAGTVRGWKSKDGWEREVKGTLQKKNTERSKNPRGAPKGNKNAVGHGAPKGSQNALKHGLFAKYLPQGVHEIYEQLADKQPIDILWENIQLTYANLLHAQRILYVQDVGDTTTMLIASTAKGGESYEVHTAWDKQGKALAAIARIQSELRNMIKTYDELTRSSLATEEQRLRIEILKSKLPDNEPENVHDDGFIKALEGIVEETWREEK
jgi:uncharacterized protein YjcR